MGNDAELPGAKASEREEQAQYVPASLDQQEPGSPELNRRQRDVLVIGWCSFLVAAIATMFFFAFVDPLTLASLAEPPLPIDRMSGYAIGFFFFWLLAAASSALTVYLIRTRQGHPPPP